MIRRLSGVTGAFSSAQREIRRMIRRLPGMTRRWERVKARGNASAGAFLAAMAWIFPALLGMAATDLVHSFWLGLSVALAPAAVIAVAAYRMIAAGVWREEDSGFLHLSHWAAHPSYRLPCKLQRWALLWAHGPYDYYALYGRLSPEATVSERRELLALCESGTLDLLRLDVDGVRPADLTAAAKAELDDGFALAQELLLAINTAATARQAKQATEAELASALRAKPDPAAAQALTRATALSRLENRRMAGDASHRQPAQDLLTELTLEADRDQKLGALPE